MQKPYDQFDKIAGMEDDLFIRSNELDEREANGLRVRLMHDPVSEIWPLYIELCVNGERQTFPVPSNEGREAFAHPYAYAPRLVA